MLHAAVPNGSLTLFGCGGCWAVATHSWVTAAVVARQRAMRRAIQAHRNTERFRGEAKRLQAERKAGAALRARLGLAAGAPGDVGGADTPGDAGAAGADPPHPTLKRRKVAWVCLRLGQGFCLGFCLVPFAISLGTGAAANARSLHR